MMTTEEREIAREAYRQAQHAKRSAAAKKAAATRAARRAEEMEAAKGIEPVKAGDVFVCSWGYDQTNIDFYEVVTVSSTGKTGEIVAIGQNVDPAGSGSDRVTPNRTRRGEKRRRVTFGTTVWSRGDVRWYFNVTSFSTAFRWNGDQHHQTAHGWGH